MNLITISSVVADTIPDGMQQVVARWKNTDAKPIAAANRARAVIIPAGMWANMLETDNKQLKLFMADAIADLAKDYLQTICNESNMARTQVPLESFALAALLQWNADRAAISGRLNGDEIKAWVLKSATLAHVTTLHGENIGTAFAAQLVKLASPNHGLKPEQAGKVLSNLWQNADADTTTGLRVMLKLQAIQNKTENTEANILASIF